MVEPSDYMTAKSSILRGIPFKMFLGNVRMNHSQASLQLAMVAA